MSENDNSWKSSLRDGESLRTPYKSPYVKNRISRSPQKNTESKDYNHWDFYRKINQVENESCIIADPFKQPIAHSLISGGRLPSVFPRDRVRSPRARYNCSVHN